MSKIFNSIVVNAPLEKVWETVKDFHDTSWSEAVLTKCAPMGNLKGDQVGAKRILNDLFHETLTDFNEDEHTLSYTIDDGPGPMSKETLKKYTGSVRLYPVTASNSTYVQWSATFESPDRKSVQEFYNPIYQALLKELEAHFS